MDFKLTQHRIAVIIRRPALLAGIETSGDFLECVFILNPDGIHLSQFGGLLFLSVFCQVDTFRLELA